MSMRHLSILFLVVLAAGCAHAPLPEIPPASGTKAPGELHKAERIGGHSAFKLRALAWWAGLPESVPIESGATNYRLTYWTTNVDGSPTLASGLLSLPTKGPVRGVVSYQHGTTTLRNEVPSANGSEEALLATAIFTGGRYITVAPDYIGLGESTVLHPYLDSKTTAGAVVDMMKAAHTFVTGPLGQTWPSSMHLTGFSQGGHATIITQRALEAMNDSRFQIAGAAPIAGPFDLKGISFPVALAGGSSSHSLYLGYLVHAYAAIQRQPVTSVIAEPYAGMFGKLYDGTNDYLVIEKTLPKIPRDMFQRDFLRDYDAGKESWLTKALAENEAYNWTPKAPMRVYFGNLDKDVSPREAPFGVAELTKRGGKVTAVSVGDYDHEGSVMHAMPKVRRWFDELSKPAGK